MWRAFHRLFAIQNNYEHIERIANHNIKRIKIAFTFAGGKTQPNLH